MTVNSVANFEQKQADFSPTKRFFVQMLTRDIELADAILDLLDNSLDGVARSQKKDPEKIDYSNYKVEIKFSKSSFEISDNCGGIPTSSIDYAFRMGKPEGVEEEKLATVGVYGIGMKRSIFKMGMNCVIATHHEGDLPFRVEIDRSWINNDSEWRIPIQTETGIGDTYGTSVCITELHKNISKSFSNKQFETDLINKIVFSYSYILEKGFSVILNGQKINPNPVSLRFERSPEGKTAIEPYIYTANIDGVEIDLIVGFHAPLASESDEEDEKY
ncbi:MAG: ATP-binding protein, partial [Campylobacterales bacterium]|nr:ATP-binding protein [Campylobacterales bacterium]